MITSMPDNSFRNRTSVANTIYSWGNRDSDYDDNASNLLMQSKNRDLTRKQYENALNSSLDNDSRSSSASSPSSSSSSYSSSSSSSSPSSSSSSYSSSSSASSSSSSSSSYSSSSSASSSSSSSSSYSSSSSSSSSNSNSNSSVIILDNERSQNQRSRIEAISNTINNYKNNLQPTIHYTPSESSTTYPTVSSGSTVINNYGDVYNVNDNNGAVVIGSSVEGGVTNNTNIDNSKNIVISGNTWTYSGGDKVINNYQQGEVVRLDSDYQGIDLQGNSFFVKSSSGSLEIQNSRDKFIGYGAGNDDVAVYSYVAGSGGAVDGRGKSQAEIMIGAENSDNQIYAGDGGSSVWGGMGGNDELFGGAGYDEFFYAVGGGNDVIQNAGDNDVVNLLGVSLSQITYAEVYQSEINIGFNDGGNLKLQGQAATGFMLEGVTYTADRSTGGWRMKN